MNKALEIRAAKVLGFKQNRERGYEGFWIVPQKYRAQLTSAAYPLKFTTSYDWAMLGVKEVSSNDILMEQFEWKLPTFKIKGKDSSYKTKWLATPEQITQAWVEVLEKTNKDKLSQQD